MKETKLGIVLLPGEDLGDELRNRSRRPGVGEAKSYAYPPIIQSPKEKEEQSEEKEQKPKRKRRRKK